MGMTGASGWRTDPDPAIKAAFAKDEETWS